MDEEQTEPGAGKLRFDPSRTRTGTVADRPTTPPTTGDKTDGLPLFTQISRLTERVENVEWWRPIWAVTAGAMAAVVVMFMAAIAGAAAAFLASWLLH